MSDKKSVPNTFRLKQGELSPLKGTFHGEFSLYAWDAVDDCLQAQCPIVAMCDYEKKGKCTVQNQYVRSVTRMIFANYASKLDEPTFYEIGMHIVPLYKQLCKLLIYEMSVENVVRTTNQGGRQVNPIYKEIRATIQLLHKMWRELGLGSMAPAPGKPNPKEPTDDDYYDRLERGAIPIKDPAEDEEEPDERTLRLIKRKNGSTN